VLENNNDNNLLLADVNGFSVGKSEERLHRKCKQWLSTISNRREHSRTLWPSSCLQHWLRLRSGSRFRPPACSAASPAAGPPESRSTPSLVLVLAEKWEMRNRCERVLKAICWLVERVMVVGIIGKVAVCDSWRDEKRW